jgi:hypothetical protein
VLKHHAVKACGRSEGASPRIFNVIGGGSVRFTPLVGSLGYLATGGPTAEEKIFLPVRIRTALVHLRVIHFIGLIVRHITRLNSTARIRIDTVDRAMQVLTP